MELETVLDEFTDTKLMDAALILELEMHMRGIYEDEPPQIPESIPGLKESVQAFKLFDEVKAEKLVKPRESANAKLDFLFMLTVSILGCLIILALAVLIRGV